MNALENVDSHLYNPHSICHRAHQQLFQHSYQRNTSSSAKDTQGGGLHDAIYASSLPGLVSSECVFACVVNEPPISLPRVYFNASEGFQLHYSFGKDSQRNNHRGFIKATPVPKKGKCFVFG